MDALFSSQVRWKYPVFANFSTKVTPPPDRHEADVASIFTASSLPKHTFDPKYVDMDKNDMDYVLTKLETRSVDSYSSGASDINSLYR